MILVTCSNGNLGKRVIRELLKNEDCPAIRAAARSVPKIEKMLASRCTLLKADYDDRSSLDIAFKRVSTLVFVSSNAGNDVRIPQHRTVIEAAQNAGIKRIVYTSFYNPVATSAFQLVQAHVATEKMLAESGIAHTILRNPMYASNIEGFVTPALESGVLAMPSASAKIAYATHDDLAAATAAVTLDASHVGKTYNLSGPEALDAFEIAARISAVLGRKIEGADIPLEGFAAHLGTLGLPPQMVDDLVSIYRAAAAGEYAEVTGDLEKLIGRKPTSIGDYAAGLATA